MSRRPLAGPIKTALRISENEFPAQQMRLDVTDNFFAPEALKIRQNGRYRTRPTQLAQSKTTDLTGGGANSLIPLIMLLRL